MSESDNLLYFQQDGFALDIKNSWPILGSVVNVIVNSTLSLNCGSREQLYQLAGISDNTITRTDLTGVIEVMPGNTVVRINFTTVLSGDTAAFDVEFDFVSDIF